jgi:cell division protein FtsZ
MADQVLHSGVRSITDLMVLPGLINLDFADVRTVMTEMGKAMMGTGEASGEGRALMAAENAIQNPLLDEVTLKGAKAVLVNITGGLDMTLLEVDEAANAITGQVDSEANVIFGAAFDPALEGMVRVSVVATGMDGASIAAIEPYEQPRKKPTRATYAEAPAPASAPAEDLEPALELLTPAPRAPEPAYATAAAPATAKPAAAPATPVPAAQPDLLFDTPHSRRTAAGPVVKTIVDPSVADAADEEPLFAGSPYADERRQKSGFMTMFSGRRPRDQMRRGPAARTGNAQPLELPDESEVDSSAELEIPSFLRRLAN